jgi:hypothetical protein
LLTVVLLTLSRVLPPPQEWRTTVEYLTAALGNALIILACAGVGLLIISRRPGNVIGWIYALVALAFAAAEFTGSYASRPLPGRVWAALLPDPLWIAAVPLDATLVLLLFPTGRLPSPPWRPVVWATLPWLRCSSRPGAASKPRLTGASTGVSTTRPRRWRRSPLGSGTSST